MKTATATATIEHETDGQYEQDDVNFEVENHDSSAAAWKPTSADRKVFKSIDRQKENQLVLEVKRTADQDLYAKLYEMRVPTLTILSRRYAYLSDSEEDLLAELRLVWWKAINHYDATPHDSYLRNRDGSFVLKNGKKRLVVKVTDFNTVFYTYCLNYIANLHKRYYSKKRLDLNGKPVKNSMLSLDLKTQGGSGSDDGAKLHEVIQDRNVTAVNQLVGAGLVISKIAGKNRKIRQALERFAFDESYETLQQACQVRQGEVCITRGDRYLFWNGGEAAENRLRVLIERTNRHPNGFVLRNWQVILNKVHYEVGVRDLDLFDKVMRAISKSKIRLDDLNPKAKTQVVV